MSEVLHAVIRESVGTRETRRLRQQGQIPAVLYGHGEKTVSLTIPAVEIEAIIRRGGKLVAIEGAVRDSALIKEVQWDPFGLEILHLDLTRVSVDEAVEVVVPVELRGEAPGIKEGGMVEHVTHEIGIRCPAGVLPDKFEVKVNSLHLGEAITVAELELPEGAELLVPPDLVIATCEEIVAEEEEEEVAPGGAEPEVIGRKEGEEEAPA